MKTLFKLLTSLFSREVNEKVAKADKGPEFEFEFASFEAAKKACTKMFQDSIYGPCNSLVEFTRNGETFWGVNSWEMY
jgi:hypothetical protein